MRFCLFIDEILGLDFDYGIPTLNHAGPHQMVSGKVETIHTVTLVNLPTVILLANRKLRPHLSNLYQAMGSVSLDS